MFTVKKLLKYYKKIINSIENKKSLIDWSGSRKYYINGYALSTQTCSDGIKISSKCLNKLFMANKFSTYNVYDKFIKSRVIGIARLNGIVTEGSIEFLAISMTLAIDAELATVLSKNKVGIVASIVPNNTKKLNGTKIINKAKITSIALVPKNKLIDTRCIIKDIYNDKIVDAKLEGH